LLESVLEVRGVQGLEVELIIFLLLLLHEQPIEVYLIVNGLYSQVNEILFFLECVEPVDDLLVKRYDAGNRPPPRVDLNTASLFELVIELEDLHLLLAGDVEQSLVVGKEFDYPTGVKGESLTFGVLHEVVDLHDGVLSVEVDQVDEVAFLISGVWLED
jgi:hypothetical protein